jgi:phosphohistidine phosphatase SixA
MNIPFFKQARTLSAALVCFLVVGQSQAQTISRDTLATVLADGGFVIVMRHANSPRELPDAATANPANVNRERQLDASGRENAESMGQALRRLMIPIGEVFSSPTFRALETASLMGFENAQAVEALSNEGMQAASAERAEWLQQQVAEAADGSNRLLITHAPNISAAFPEYSDGMTEGEALIFDPSGAEEPVMVHRIRIDEWANL